MHVSSRESRAGQPVAAPSTMYEAVASLVQTVTCAAAVERHLAAAASLHRRRAAVAVAGHAATDATAPTNDANADAADAAAAATDAAAAATSAGRSSEQEMDVTGRLRAEPPHRRQQPRALLGRGARPCRLRH
eukprot:scaffold59_cov70-Phaeocystis_antarctica.AAC.4